MKLDPKRSKTSTKIRLTPTRWRPGICLVCGEQYDVLTHYHAGLHGFKRAEYLIKAGKVKLL